MSPIQWVKCKFIHLKKKCFDCEKIRTFECCWKALPLLITGTVYSRELITDNGLTFEVREDPGESGLRQHSLQPALCPWGQRLAFQTLHQFGFRKTVSSGNGKKNVQKKSRPNRKQRNRVAFVTESPRFVQWAGKTSVYTCGYPTRMGLH